MKYAVVIYHKNVNSYPRQWIDKCVESLEFQTDQDFEVFELEYGNALSHHSILQSKFEGRKHYHNVEFSNHADAMNYIYSKAFLLCDVVFNVNIDDYYSVQRISQQKKWLEFYDIVSSDYRQVINEEEGNTEHLAAHDINMLFNNLNVVSNPCHAMHKRVFEKQKFNPELIPREDLEYWKQAVQNDFKIGIIPSVLHYYRIHGTQVGKGNS